MTKKIMISLVLILILSTTTIDKVVEAQLQQNNQNTKENTSKLSTYETQENQLRLSIQELDNKIESAMYKQAKLEEDINTLNNMIQKSNEEIEKYTKEIETKENLKNTYLRNMYKFGELSYVDFIFKSDNVFDAAYSFYNYSFLVESSKKNIEELNELNKSLLDEQKKLELNKSELEKSNADIKNIVNELVAMKKEQQEKLNKLNSIQLNLIYKIENEKSAAKIITAMLEEQRLKAEVERQKQKESNNESTEVNSYTAVEIVAYANKFQGVPYVWGGTTPKGFDCSGLVQYCFSQFGYSLPRVSQDQQNFGTDVSISDLKTGDLVFWGRPATHVAFYIDGGYILHAPNTGDVVRIQSVNLNSITSAKRIIN